MKCALDIGNSSVKGMLLTDSNEVISPLRFPSSVVTVADAKYLTFTNEDDVYIQVIDSPLAHMTDIVAVGQKAIDMPDYREYDVTSTSYKANHEIKRRAERREKWMQYVAPTKDKFIEVVTDTILKTYGKRDYFDAIIFIGGGFTALTGYRVDLGQVQMNDTDLFDTLNEKLQKNHKSVDLLFGVPAPYSQGINERGLTQVLTNMQS